jgi:fibrillarin-like pre-rRNA processing protein
VVASVEPHLSFQEIFWVTLEEGSKRLATKNLVLGHAVYGERLVMFKGVEYRVWDAFRSKLAAAIMKGLDTVPIQPSHKVLYLGAASGTTASHVSDIVGEKGHVYCVEFAPRSIRDLVNNVCAFRMNMSPILADARLPERYSLLVEKVDDVYCDIAQPEQAKILADNADQHLKAHGWIMLAVKTQSIDVTKEPSEVYREETSTLKKRGFRIQQVVNLEPYEKAHAMIVAQKKP